MTPTEDVPTFDEPEENDRTDLVYLMLGRLALSGVGVDIDVDFDPLAGP